MSTASSTSSGGPTSSSHETASSGCRIPKLAFARHAGKLRPRKLRHLLRSNVVIHATVRGCGRSVIRDTLAGRSDDGAFSQSPRFAMATSTERSSPFCHTKLTTPSGKVLVFPTGNFIRAGKHTHADAVLGILQLMHWVSGTGGMQWPTAFSVPNTVLSGAYRTPISEAVRKHWRAVYTKKFPGIALTFDSLPGTTIELFLGRGKFIVPGCRDGAFVGKVVAEMSRLYEEADAL